MVEADCKFSIGQLVHHRRFDYRGVIVDVDATFQGTESWYQQNGDEPSTQGRTLLPRARGQGSTHNLRRRVQPRAG